MHGSWSTPDVQCQASRHRLHRRLVVVSCNRQTYQPLEQAVQTINKAISFATRNDGEKPPGLLERRAKKNVVLVAKVETSKPVQDAPDGADKSLRKYLALPLDQYSLLDPLWISRGEQQDNFIVRVPLIDLVGLDLVPGVSIKVQVDADNAEVRFIADNFTCGDPTLDQVFSVELLGLLSTEEMLTPVPPSTGGGGSTLGDQKWSRLKCGAHMTLSMQVPYPLSMVPRPLLSSTGSLLMKVAMQSLAPTFLDMLIVDYTRWVRGSDSRNEAAGSLLPKQPARQLDHEQAELHATEQPTH